MLLNILCLSEETFSCFFYGNTSLLFNYKVQDIQLFKIYQVNLSRLDKFPGTSVLSLGAKPGQAHESEVKITGKKSLKLFVGSGLARSSSLPKV